MLVSDVWEELTAIGRRYRLPDRAATSLVNQAKAFERSGMVSPEIAFLKQQAEDLRERRTQYKKEAARLVKDTAIYEWVENTAGLSDFTYIMLGQSSPRISLEDFYNPSCLWKHYGLHPKEEQNCPPIRTSYATNRLVEPIIRLGEGGGDLRRVYDDRKAHTMETHPPMLDEGEGCEFCDRAYAKREQTGKGGWDCSNVGGPHWKAAHRHQDAIRITAKEVLTNLWRIEHGQSPREGHGANDSHQFRADREAVHA